MNLIGDALETARQRFMEKNGSYYDRLVKQSRRSVQTWLDMNDDTYIHEAVKYAAGKYYIDDEGLKEELYASLRFRCLAGIMRQPVRYDPEEPMGGVCAHQEYNVETGGWECKVGGNQAQADAWHEKFGHSPACPFHEPPESSQEKSASYEMEDDEDLYEAFQKLDIGRIKGM